MIATKLIAHQEHRTRRCPEHRRRVCLMSMICFHCLRVRSHVSDSREFQNHPSLAEGYHVLDCTVILTDDGSEPPAIMCRHEPRSTLGSTSQDVRSKLFGINIHHQCQPMLGCRLQTSIFMPSSPGPVIRTSGSDSYFFQNCTTSFERLVDRILLRFLSGLAVDYRSESTNSPLVQDLVHDT